MNHRPCEFFPNGYITLTTSIRNMTEILDLFARMILDSRGNPTVEVELFTASGSGKAAVPSGASTGTHEAVELRDGGEAFGGKGVEKAIDNVNNTIAPAIIGMDASNQREIDLELLELDGTPNKGILGANAMLAVSMASACASADVLDIPLFRYLGGFNACVLPVPSMNVINGGEHAGNSLDIQEHMILPTGAGSFIEAMQMGTETYHALGKMLTAKYGKGSTNVGDEGGFAPPIQDPEEPFALILEAIDECGYAGKIGIGMDAAASEFYDTGKGTYSVGGKDFSSGELVDFYRELAGKFKIISIEDPFHEDDWDGFRELTSAIGNSVQIVGDDLYVTNMERLGRGVREGTTNGLLLKVNQIGTVTEAVDAAAMAHRAGFGVMVSHRSGETEDTFISDLTVAINAGQLKSGAPARGERTAKYNQLIRIEEFLDREGRYAGENFINPFAGF